MVRAFISAENPDYKKLPMRANNARMYQLEHDLEVAGAKHVRSARFVDTSNGYTENSFVADLPLSEAIRLGQAYQQESILVDGMGILNLHTFKVNPITAKHTGKSAERRTAFSVIFDGHEPKFVAYDIDFAKSRRLRR